MQKNLAFRKRTFKGARIEDIYLKIQNYKSSSVSKEEALLELEKFIELVMGYEPNKVNKEKVMG